MTSTRSDSGLPKRDSMLLEVRDLKQKFSVPGGMVHAVDGVSFNLNVGESLGLVGESGCGKSTLARSIMRLYKPTSGSVKFLGQEITTLRRAGMRKVSRRLQMIFQDPISSLNPRRRAADIIAEGLAIHGIPPSEISQRTEEIMAEVGLDREVMGERRPSDFSGGQCQRIAIARAMTLEPKLLICDEPVSALDVSVQAQVLNLLERMRQDHDLAMLFISHDLSVVRHISDRVAVMYLGRIMELGDTDSVYRKPLHPYTRALIDSVPQLDPGAKETDTTLTGELPSPLHPPSGCRFRTRCPLAQQVCAEKEPELRPVREGHLVACHFPLVEVDSRQYNVGSRSYV